MRKVQVYDGWKIKQARVEKRLKVCELAAAVGISQSRLSNYECGFRGVPDEIAVKIAAVLGVPLHRFRIVALPEAR